MCPINSLRAGTDTSPTSPPNSSDRLNNYLSNLQLVVLLQHLDFGFEVLQDLDEAQSQTLGTSEPNGNSQTSVQQKHWRRLLHKGCGCTMLHSVL